MIELTNVSKTYEGQSTEQVRALDGVSLRIDSGEFVAIQGPSGSGKSTLMNILGFLDTPSGGEYKLNQEIFDNHNTDILARVRNEQIGFVFQSFHLLKRINAVENVELPLIYSNRQNTRQMAMKALESVGLKDRAMHKPAQLSGGQQQRVAIARALVNEPGVILADEPTGNLDSQSTAEVLNILQGLNEQGKTIIMVTHEAEVAHTAKRQIHIVDGQIASDSQTHQS